MFVSIAYTQTGEQDVIRHGIVSTHTNSGFPPFDHTFFSSHIFWLLLFFGLFYWFIASFIIPQIGGIIEKRQQLIKSDLQSAFLLKKEVDVIRLEYEEKLRETHKQAEHIMLLASRRVSADNIDDRLNADHCIDSELTERINHITNVRDAALQKVEDSTVQIVKEIIRKFTNNVHTDTVILETIRDICKVKGSKI